LEIIENGLQGTFISENYKGLGRDGNGHGQLSVSHNWLRAFD